MDAAIQMIHEVTAIAEEIGLRSGLSWLAVVDLAAIYAFLGDFDRAVECVERAIATADPELPARLCIAKAVLAEICLQRGEPVEAEALLAPYPEQTLRDTIEATAAISARPVYARAEVALAQGDLARVLAVTDDLLASAQNMGMAILLPTTLHLRAKALWKLGRGEEAYATLLEGRARAEATHARARLLPILMTLAELELALDHPIEAEAARIAGCDVVAYIAEHSPEDLRASFLSLPAVRAIVSA
jgi:ATP/maltotriose-dependent transcriptional regulator MalT